MLQARLKILLTAALWSTAGAAIKLCHLNAWQITAGRSLIAALTMFILLPQARKKIPFKALPVMLAHVATVTLFILSNKLTTSANAIFLQSGAPLYIMILSPWILREFPSRSEWLSAPLYAMGLLIIVWGNLSWDSWAGNAAAIGAGVGFAMVIMNLRRLREGHIEAMMAWANILVVVLLLPWALQGPPASRHDIAIILYLGIFQLGLAYSFFTSGLKHLPASQVGLLALLEPILNPIWAYLIAKENPGSSAVLGGALILIATIWRTFHAPAKKGSLNYGQTSVS